MKKICFFSVLIITLFILFMPSYKVYAAEETTGASIDGSRDIGISWSEIDRKAQEFMKGDPANKEEIDVSALVKGLANILTTIGVIVVLAGILIMGMKYMTASPDEAAKLKTKLVGLVISGIVIIGAYGIWKIIGSVLESMTMNY